LYKQIFPICKFSTGHFTKPRIILMRTHSKPQLFFKKARKFTCSHPDIPPSHTLSWWELTQNPNYFSKKLANLLVLIRTFHQATHYPDENSFKTPTIFQKSLRIYLFSSGQSTKPHTILMRTHSKPQLFFKKAREFTCSQQDIPPSHALSWWELTQNPKLFFKKARKFTCSHPDSPPSHALSWWECKCPWKWKDKNWLHILFYCNI